MAFDGSSTAPEEKIYFDPHFPYELVNRSSFVDLIAARAAAYRREYDAVPEFRAGIHGGPVVVAQCGDFNQEIVYFGDTVNTAARVQQRCKDVGRPLLVSGDLVARMILPDAWKAEQVSSVQLRGRAGETDI